MLDRRGGALETLAPTGPLIGLAGLGEPAHAAGRSGLGPGDLLVLARRADRARDPAGGFLAAERVHAWIVETDPASPQRFVNALLARITRYGRGRTGDDLALLAVPPQPGREEPAGPSG